MIFRSIEKDRAWLYCTRSRRGYWWPEGLRSSCPAFLDSGGITCYLPRAEEFHLSISESGLRVGLELSAFAFQFPSAYMDVAEIFWKLLCHPPKSTIAGNRKKNYFLYSFFLNMLIHSCP